VSLLLAAALADAPRDASIASGPGSISTALVPCPMPRSVGAERGWTRAVACAPPAGGGRPIRGPARALFGLRFDLNEADERLLETLPGIGPARAAAIVAERQRRAFASVDELARVRGIGPRTVERLRGLLVVDPARPEPKPARLLPARASTDGEG